MGELIGSIRQLWNGNNLHLIKSHANILYTKQGNLSNNECSTAHSTPQKGSRETGSPQSEIQLGAFNRSFS